jgi:Novel STAND NTPase 1
MRASPYTGLMPFSERQAPFFFGRDGEREIVTANLLASRLTVLYGPSGVGKSSLLNAGVAYHLRRQARQNLEERGTSEYRVIVFGSWRDDPLRELARAVSRQVGEEVPGTFEQKLQAVSSRLDCDLLIILDQFEEYFLYHGHENGNGAFAREFGQAVNRSNLRVSFLISIREDSLAKLDRFQGSIPTILENRLRIDHLDFDAAREAISKPIEKLNGRPAMRGNPVTIEDALVEHVLDQVRASRKLRRERVHGMVERAITVDAAEERVETPYLQLVMTRLWEEEQRAGSHALRADTLDRLGGAEKIVSSHLDAAVGSLTQAETDMAARVFNHLVTPSRTKIAHSVPDLANYVGVTPDALVPLLQKLSTGQNRLLTPVEPAPDQPAHLRYQILHDILAGPVLEWRTRYMQGRARAEAEAQAEAQRRRAEQEARARARLRKVSMLLLAMVIISSGLAWVARLQVLKAEERRVEAEAAKLDAEVAKHTAQAGRLELEAAITARSAAERAAELNHLQAQAAKAELQGALEQARRLRQRAAETQKQVVSAQAASVSLNREAQAERKSAATSHLEVDRMRRLGDQVIDRAGIMTALEKYQAAYRSFDLDALATVYPKLPSERRKHLKQSKEACQTYEVMLSVLHMHPGVADTAVVEVQSSYQCVSKTRSVPQVFSMREDFTVRKDRSGSWIIESMTAPPVLQGAIDAGAGRDGARR